MGFHLSYQHCYEEEDYIWFSEIKFNGFYKMKKDTLKAEFLFHFPGENIETARLHGKVEKVGDWLVFFPIAGKNITLYHLVTEEVKTFPLKEMTGEYLIKYLPNAKIARCFSFGNVLYFTPSTYPAIVKLDLETMSLTYLTQWRTELETHILKDRAVQLNIYFGGIQEKEEGLLLACCCAPCVLHFDVQTEQFRITKIQTTAPAFQTMREIEEELWLMPRLGITHTFWNPDTGETQTKDIDIRTNPEERILGTGAIPNSDDFFMTAMVEGERKFFSYSLKNEEISPWQELDKLIPKTRDLSYPFFPDIFFIPRQEDTFRFFSGRDHCLYTFNLKTLDTTKSWIEADKVATEILSKRSLTFQENKNANMSDYFDYVSNHTEKEIKNDSQTIGQAILTATT